jgi:hypothetical protein
MLDDHGEFEMAYDPHVEAEAPDRLTLTLGNIESQWLAATPEREAADDLLAICEAMLNWYDSEMRDGSGSEVMNRARDVIEKIVAERVKALARQTP